MTVHNRRETTLRCLRNLRIQSLPPRIAVPDVFLTDDGCTDGTPEAIRSEFPAVHIIQGDGTLFWNKGMYTAWQEAARQAFDFFLWINDDTFLFEDSLSRLLQASDHHRDKAILVGSTSASEDPERVTYGGWRDGKLITDLSSEQVCDTFNGNIVLVPHDVFRRIGANDPHYRHSLGDFDYGLRAKKAGIDVYTAQGGYGICDTHNALPVWMDPGRPIKERWKHFFSPTGNNPFEFFYFKRKHYGFWSATASFLSNFVHFLLPRLWPQT